MTRLGRNELAAVFLAGCIVVAMGLLLAGLGSLNAQGPSTTYTDDSESEEPPNNACSYADTHRESCEDTWARVMAGAGDNLWNGDDDWIESQCKKVEECIESLSPPIAHSQWGNPTPTPDVLPGYWDGLLCGNDYRLMYSPEELRRDQARFYASQQRRQGNQ